MSWYICKNCGAVTCQSNLAYYHFRSDYGEGGVAVYEGKAQCPDCGSTDVQVVNACDMCNEPTQDDNHELCEACTRMAKEIAEYANNKWGIDLHALVCLLDDYEGDRRRNL